MYKVILFCVVLAQAAFADAKILMTLPVVQQVIEVQLDPHNCPVLDRLDFSNGPSLQCTFDNLSIGVSMSGAIIGTESTAASLYNVQVTPGFEPDKTILKITSHSNESETDLRTALAAGQVKVQFVYRGTP